MLTYILTFLDRALAICLEVAPWLLAGLVLAGLLKVFLPTNSLKRWLGGRGIGPVLKAALIGTPLPLCSCSVLPAAMQLHRSGASKGATVSFLVATPENGADSIALSYVLLGPVMTILRPAAAIASAVATGLLVECLPGARRQPAADGEAGCSAGGRACRDQIDCDRESGSEPPARWSAASRAAVDLLDDIAPWLFGGLLLAAALETVVPPGAMAGFGSGLLPMLALAAIGIPMYICATASTPLAASMLVAGMSPGTVLVFLLTGPATNLASAAVVGKQLGVRVTAAYLLGLLGSAIGIGLAVDRLLGGMNLELSGQINAAGELIPAWIAILSGIVLAAAAIKPLRRFSARVALRAIGAE
ncbi:MAG: SO_0444 family Cu/Zn efflux transporter [Planctomycetota bacterium]|nr:SO_0444 family Cu/Zn efflux transporter [Planctomycetota bacterium]